MIDLNEPLFPTLENELKTGITKAELFAMMLVVLHYNSDEPVNVEDIKRSLRNCLELLQ